MTTTTDLDNVSSPHPLAASLRPVVDAGGGRACALMIVGALLATFADRPFPGDYFMRAMLAISDWYGRAVDVTTGKPVFMWEAAKPSDRPPPMSIEHVATIADRLASQFWCLARPGEPIPVDRWALYDLATMLRRACQCSGQPWTWVTSTAEAHERFPVPGGSERVAAALAHHLATRDHLLPLIVEEARRMCVELKIDPSPIEAAIVRFGGVPS